MVNRYVGAGIYQFGKTVAKKLTGNKSKVSDTITSIRPGTGLTTKKKIEGKVIKAVDEGTKKALKGAPPSQSIKQSASKMKRDESKKLKGVSYEYDRLTKKFAKEKAKIEKKKKIKTAAGATAVGSGTVAAGLAFKKIRDKKMGGGMMGRRMGYSEGNLAVTPREKQLAAQYGDKKRITRGDVIKAAKSKSGKRMQASVGGGADMTKVASDKTKKKAKKFEKRAKAASKDIKNIGRSFSSIQREKYMR
jgi:hypothetical protein